MAVDICHVKLSTKAKDTIDYFTLDDFQENLDFLENHKHLILPLDNDDGTQTLVLYYVEKGYQRKQVTDDFIYAFENDKLYFDLATVKKAKLFLKAHTEGSQKEIEQIFQSNFIDNFVEGESVFFISW